MGCCADSEIKILAKDNTGNSSRNVLQPLHDVASERSFVIEVVTCVAATEQPISQAVVLVVPEIYTSSSTVSNVDVDEVLAADSVSLCGRVDEEEFRSSMAEASSFIDVGTQLPSSGGGSGGVLPSSNQDYPASPIRDPAWSPSVGRGDVDSAWLLCPDGSLVHMMLSVESGDE